jgi:hypothetical protein
MNNYFTYVTNLNSNVKNKKTRAAGWEPAARNASWRADRLALLAALRRGL